jgi:integrase
MLATRDASVFDVRAAWVAWLAGHPSTTNRSRLSDLRIFGRWLAGHIELAPSTEQQVAFALVAQGPSHARAVVHAWDAAQLCSCRPSTRARRLATLCSWVRECQRHGLSWGLMVERPNVRAWQCRDAPSGEAIEKVLADLETPRDRLALLLLYDVGLRRAEAVSLEVGSARVSASGRPYIELRRKGGAVVTRTISVRCARAIAAAIGTRTCGPLLLARDGHRLTDAGLAALTVRWGLGRPHALRRAGATEVYRRTHDVELVRDYLGHSDFSTTQRYVQQLDDGAGQATAILAGEA